MASFLKDGKLPSSETRARKVAAQVPHYSLVSGVLYYIDPRKRSYKRAVLTQHLQQTVMAEAHSGPFSGHFAVNKLYQILATQWYWEKMYAGVESYCKNCLQCVIVSGCGRQNRLPLHPIPVQRPIQIVGVDIVDLPATQQGNKHVVVFQDFFSYHPACNRMVERFNRTLKTALCKHADRFGCQIPLWHTMGIS